MAQFLQLFANPDRMRPSFHRDACVGHIRQPLLDRLRHGSEAAAIYDFTVFVESAVMAPDVSEVDADRRGNSGLSAWNFRDEVLRWLLQGIQLPPSRTCSSHFSLSILRNRLRQRWGMTLNLQEFSDFP
jgi:hypothetical protein